MECGAKRLLDVLEMERPGILRFLRQRLGCSEAADDVFQTLSERIVSTSLSSAVTNPKAYLFRAAANVAHSYDRAAATRLHYEAAAAADAPAIDVRGPERILASRDALQTVKQALAELPPLTQRMFVAFRLRDMSQRDIAARYGVSLSTVEKHIAKAVKHCHQRLSESGYGKGDRAAS